jgi:hypothetical protein
MTANDLADEIAAMQQAWPNAPPEVWSELHEHIHIEEQIQRDAQSHAEARNALTTSQYRRPGRRISR